MAMKVTTTWKGMNPTSGTTIGGTAATSVVVENGSRARRAGDVGRQLCRAVVISGGAFGRAEVRSNARTMPTLIPEKQSLSDHHKPSRDHSALSGDEPKRAGVFRLRPRPRQATPHRVFVINWAGLLPRRKYR
jgi:hypothetical protein